MFKPFYFTNEGLTLTGTLELPDSAAAVPPAVVFYHGFTGNRIEAGRLFVKTARHLARRGFASLRFDFRGSGESEGEFRDMTASTEISDGLRAIDALAATGEIDPERIGVVGLSLGGLVGASAAGRDPRAKSLVLWSAVAEVKELWDEIDAETPFKGLMKSQGFIERSGLAVGLGFYNDLANHDPLASVRKSRAPVLVVAGGGDQVVPPEHSDRYVAAARAPGRRAEKLVIEGADHCFGRIAWQKELIEATARWFEETL